MRTVTGMGDYLTLEQAGALLGLDAWAVHRQVRAGELVGVRTQDGRWLVRRQNLQAFADDREQARRP